VPRFFTQQCLLHHTLLSATICFHKSSHRPQRPNITPPKSNQRSPRHSQLAKQIAMVKEKADQALGTVLVGCSSPLLDR